MGEAVEPGDAGWAPQPLKALGVALLVDLACVPFMFVLLIAWPFVLLTVVPYVGGRLAGRYVGRTTAVRVGVVGALAMMTLMVAILFSLLAQFPGDQFDPLEPIGLSIVAIGYLVSSLFGAIGGRHGVAIREGS